MILNEYRRVEQSQDQRGLAVYGGYTLLEGVFNKAPETQVITTLGGGAITVNDPFLAVYPWALPLPQPVTRRGASSARRQA